jgi:pre-mRNA-splicing factor SYF1
LTHPVPTPTTHPDLLSAVDLRREEELLHNPHSFRHWWTAIHTTKEALNTQQKAAPLPDVVKGVAVLLGPLTNPVARASLQKLTYLFESALVHFPGSFKLWKAYLETRSWYVLGKSIKPKRAGGRKKLQEMKDALEDEKADMLTWDGGLDGIVGWEEWKGLVATFERALMYLPHVSTILFKRCQCPYPCLLDASTVAALLQHFLPS